MNEEFCMLVNKLPELMEQLLNDPLKTRKGLGKLLQEGIYVFYENSRPIYVGRTNRLKERVLEHGRKSSNHNKAPFAFNLAKKAAKDKGLNVNIPRVELERNEIFKELFLESKKRVSEMQIRFVPELNPNLQTIFEVYASMELGTKEFNSFDNH